MIDKKIVKSVFKQCKDALSIPYTIELNLDWKSAVENDQSLSLNDYGLCRATEIHGDYIIYINPDHHESIEELKNTCIHELLHTYMMPSMTLAIIGSGQDKADLFRYVHEKDIATMATSLCRTIKVKEEDIIPSEFKA